VSAIADYQKANKLRVYYQFYNPWDVPFTQRIPLSGYSTPSGEMNFGVRIMPANVVHDALGNRTKSWTPKLSDLRGLLKGAEHEYGWRLEHFALRLWLGCTEGDHFEGVSDTAIQSLFYRRSGPISAAIAITIEGPATDN
jgi:hypothetical protein